MTKQDSLGPTAALVAGLLGREHPVAANFSRLAESNLSAATRAARRQRCMLLEARSSLLSPNII